MGEGRARDPLELAERRRRSLGLGPRLPLALQQLVPLVLDALAADELAQLPPERRQRLEQLRVARPLRAREGLDDGHHLAFDEQGEGDARAQSLCACHGGAHESRVLERLDPDRLPGGLGAGGQRLRRRRHSRRHREEAVEPEVRPRPRQSRLVRVARPEGRDVVAGDLAERAQHRPDRLRHALRLCEDAGDGVLQLDQTGAALPVRHLLDDTADAEQLAVRRQHRVVAGEPVAARVGPARRRRRELDRDRGLARGEHPLQRRPDRGGEVRDHLLERPADVLRGRKPVHARERVVDAEVAELGVPDAEPDRRAAVERVEQRARLPHVLESSHR